MPYTARQCQIQITFPAHTARLGIDRGELALRGGDINAVIHEDGIDLVEAFTLAITDPAGPAALEFDLLVDFLQFYGFTRIEIIIAEPTRNRATARTEREAHHQHCARELSHQLASSATPATGEAGRRVSSVRTLLSSTTLYWPNSAARSRPSR